MAKRNRLIAAVMVFMLSVISAAALFPGTAKAAAPGMTICAIDLGAGNSGEATMIVPASGNSLLIDTGENTTNNLLKWLEDNGYKKGSSKKFDLLISHWHPDHMGYAKELINGYNVEKIYIPPEDKNNANYYNNTINAAGKKKKTTENEWVVEMYDGMKINVGTSITGKVLVVNKNPKLTEKGAAKNAKGNRENNMSAVIRFEGGGSSFLTCGDIRCETEEELLKGTYGVKKSELKADIFKMSHHGYFESNSTPFLKVVNPSYAWFTTHDATEKEFVPESVTEPVRVTSSMANVFSTRYNGTIYITSSGGKISVSADRNVSTLYVLKHNRKTNHEGVDEFTINKGCVPRISDKMIDSSLYQYWQVSGTDKSIFKAVKVETHTNPKTKEEYKMMRDKTGVYAAGTLAVKDGKYYLFGENGRTLKGLQDVDYLFDKNGKRFPGRKPVYKKTYFFNESSGERVEGFAKSKKNGKTFTYYLMNSKCPDFEESERGVMTTGFRTINGNKYYLTDEKLSDYTKAKLGRRVENAIVKIKDEKTNKFYKYCFNENGVMQTGFTKFKENWYYYSPDNGRMLYGKQKADGKYRFFDKSTGMMYVNKTVTIDGKTYMCDKDGVMRLQTGTNASNSVSKDSKGGIIEAQPDESTQNAPENGNIQDIPENGNTETGQTGEPVQEEPGTKEEDVQEQPAPEEVKEDAEAENADTEEIKEEQKEETDTAAAEEENAGAAEQTETQETAEQQDTPAGQEIPDAEMEIIEPAA